MILKDLLEDEIEKIKLNQVKESVNLKNSNVFIASLFQNHLLIQGTLRLFYRNIINLMNDIELGLSEFEKSIRLLEMQDELIKYSGYLADEEMRYKGYLETDLSEEARAILISFIESLKDKDCFIEDVSKRLCH